MHVIKKHWFLLALGFAFVVGFSAPGLFLGFAESQPARNAIVIAVLFLMALPLEASVVWQTVRKPWAALLGTAVNFGVCPLLALVASQWLTGDLAIGVLVAAAAPCTLASAAVWTRQAGGNDVTALLVTVLTNATCFLLTPLWLTLTTRTETQLEVWPMISRLGLLVVLPMVLAQIVRLIPAVKTRATGWKSRCGTLAQLGILSMVLVGAVKSRMQLLESQWEGSSISMSNMSLMVVSVVCVHLATLAIGFQLAKGLGFSREDQIAVAMAGSQKTLMVGLYVAIAFFDGLVILPMVVYHIGQLVADTVIGQQFLAHSQRMSGNARP